MDFQKFLSNKMSELGISYRQLENKTGISRDQQLLKSAYIVGMVRALGEQNVN